MEALPRSIRVNALLSGGASCQGGKCEDWSWNASDTGLELTVNALFFAPGGTRWQQP